MRDLFLMLVLPGSLIYALSGPMRGLFVLNLLCFTRLWTFSYGAFRSLPVFQVAIIAAFLSAFLRGKVHLRFPAFLILHTLFHAWIMISNQVGYKPKQSWEFYSMFMYTLPIVPIFLFATIRDLRTWKIVMWCAAGGLGLIAAKTGASSAAKGGSHISSMIDGFVGDNNVLGLTVCLAVGVLFGLRHTLPKKAAFAFYPFIIAAFLCIIFTKSRGAFLSMSVILILSSLASKAPVRNLVLLVLCAFLGYKAVPATYFDRLETFENIEEDNSAMNRIFFWKLSWQQAVENPFFGIGMENHMDYNEEVTPAALEGRKNHVAHSVYFQVLAEAGFVGFGMYLTMAIWTLLLLHRTYRSTRKLEKQHPDLAWVSPLTFWMRNAYCGYLFGSAFLNMLVIDFPWYFMWYAHLLPYVLKREIDKRQRKANAAWEAAQGAGAGPQDEAPGSEAGIPEKAPESGTADPGGRP